MNKVEMFNDEYKYIKNKKYVDNIKILINLLPDYFFHVAAASTGKYHPSFAQGEGGLLRHTKVAVKIAHELLENDSISSVFKSEEKDLMLCAIMLHDGIKHGLDESEYTVFDHPLQASKFIKDNKDKLTLTDNEILFMCNVIETHMGQWTKDYKGNEVLEKPVNKYQKFVHMCDFLASRKFLDVKFNGNNIIS